MSSAYLDLRFVRTGGYALRFRCLCVAPIVFAALRNSRQVDSDDEFLSREFDCVYDLADPMVTDSSRLLGKLMDGIGGEVAECECSDELIDVWPSRWS